MNDTMLLRILAVVMIAVWCAGVAIVTRNEIAIGLAILMAWTAGNMQAHAHHEYTDGHHHD